MKTLVYFIGIILLFVAITFSCNMCSDGMKTVEDQYKPSALLKKYEDFKNLSAAIDEKLATLEVYKEELLNFKVDKDNRYYYELRKSEALGILSVYNSLCKDYNSRMSKFNYRFTNKGDLPESNMKPLPREYKPYILTLK